MDLPPDEAERLAALINYGVLDSDFEESFDRVTRVAAHLFQTPISLISLLDEKRQWFKSAVGITVRETPRDVAFCNHVILARDVMVVPDATQDSRFMANPLVTTAPNVRFYAGAPIMDPDGYALGTVCVIDRQARPTLSANQQKVLEDFAGIVSDLLEARKAGRLADRKNRLSSGR